MDDSFRLALAQTAPVRYEKDANLERAEELMQRARAAQAQAILFPELFLTGYLVWDRLGDLAEPLQGPSITRLSRMAQKYGLLSIVGFPQLVGRSIYNSACVLERDGSILGTYQKTHLFADEPGAFTAGDSFVAFDSSIGRIGILICYDIEFPECARALALDGVQVILTPTANMEPFQPEQGLYARTRARENGIFVAVANLVGHDEKYRYFGRSIVVDPSGRVLAEADSGEGLVIAELTLSAVKGAQRSSPYLRLRRPELYAGLGSHESQGSLPALERGD